MARVPQPIQLAATPAGLELDPDFEGRADSSDQVKLDPAEVAALDL